MNYKTYLEAHDAARKMRQQHAGNDVMVRVEPSPYGGFQVKLMPADLSIDLMSRSYGQRQPNAYR